MFAVTVLTQACSEPAPEQNRDTTARLLTPVAAAGWLITPEQAEPIRFLGAAQAPPPFSSAVPQQIWISIQARAINQSNEAAALSMNDFVLVDRSGRRFPPVQSEEVEAFLAETGSEAPGKVIPAGAGTTIRLVFLAPVETDVVRLFFQPGLEVATPTVQ